jgi:hypothetical protein
MRLYTAAILIPALVVACGSSGSEFDDGKETGSGADLQNGQLGGDGNASVNPGGVTRDSACATGTAAAQRGVSFLTFQFDRSGSMGSTSDPNSQISVCRNVLRDFFADPASAGLSAALALFPQRDGDNDLLCAPTDYDTPAPGGALTALPNTALSNAAAQIQTVSGTPTLPALKGAHALAASVSAANGGAKVAVVLVTDGEPNDCSSNVTNVSTFAEGARATTPTYVIGIGSELTSLNRIAQAGSGRDAFLVDTSNPTLVQQQFRSALDVVRALSANCEMAMPAPPAGQTLDTRKVNVLVSVSGAEASPSYDTACAGEGWHYDNDQTPTKVILCPATCQKVQSDPAAKVDVLFGCSTSSVLR